MATTNTGTGTTTTAKTARQTAIFGVEDWTRI